MDSKLSHHPFENSISADSELDYPGDSEIEKKLGITSDGMH